MTGAVPQMGYAWVRPVTAVLVCGLSCRAPMHSFSDDGNLWFGCAPDCERRRPVNALDVAGQLLRVVAQLRCMAGLSDQDRLCRVGEVEQRVSVCTHGAALSVRWVQPPVMAAPATTSAHRPTGGAAYGGDTIWRQRHASS